MAEFARMDDYRITTYGEMWAPYYDKTFDKSESEVAFLRPLAGDPPRALELAIGTGRVGLPLSQAGVEVVGIDASREMVDLLRGKTGGEQIDVMMGDFADVAVDGSFPLIYLTFNTLFALTSQQRQIECFHNVARALDPGGRFVLDAFVPDLKRFDQYQTRIGVSSITSTSAHIYELSTHDPVGQTVSTHHVRRLEDGSTVVLPVEIRYVWPSEMDLMATLAGLEIEGRWDWYDRRPFTGRSGQHVSVYRKPT
jgi:SAM-dependent methyltransferase